MSRATKHPLQPRTDHDGRSRRLAILASKRAIRAALEPGLRQAFDQYAGDETAIRATEAYRLWASATRASQDRMWRVLAGQIDADYARIAEAAATATATPAGSLSADGPAAPGYQYEACIHGQPGGYMLDRSDTDLAAGLLYEAGGNLYAMGQGIGQRDSKAERLIAHIREIRPAFAPRRVLEMGCSAGAQTTDYPAAFPGAEIHAIDLSPAMLRFAHARAETLEAPIHFHRVDAANTPFPDSHFDLIVSHNMFHEVAASHMPDIMRECRRLLAPGGICLHQDVPIQTMRLDPYTRFISERQKDDNDEPFWLDFANADLPRMMIDAGFDAEHVRIDYLEAVDGPVPWYVVTASVASQDD